MHRLSLRERVVKVSWLFYDICLLMRSWREMTTLTTIFGMGAEEAVATFNTVLEAGIKWNSEN